MRANSRTASAPRPGAPLRSERRQLQRPQELNFVLELNPVGLVCSAPSLGRRYERPSSAGVRQAALVPSTTSARTRIADQSLPYAPAFIRTPPPTVPGIAHANSNPPRPAARTR